MLSAFKNVYAKDDVKKEHPVSLLGGTGVVEEDLLMVIPIFSCWCENHPDANIIDFFRVRNVSKKVIRAFATVGLKTVIDELNKQAEVDSKAKGKKEKKEKNK